MYLIFKDEVVQFGEVWEGAQGFAVLLPWGGVFEPRSAWLQVFILLSHLVSESEGKRRTEGTDDSNIDFYLSFQYTIWSRALQWILTRYQEDTMKKNMRLQTLPWHMKMKVGDNLKHSANRHLGQSACSV